MRAPAGRPVQVRVTFDDDDGTPVPAESVTWTVTDGAGATSDPAPADADGDVWRAVLPARDRLDQLIVRFSGMVDGLEHTVTVAVDVVGQRLVPLHRLREAVRDAAPQLYDGAPPDPGLLRAAADAAEDWIDDALGYPAVRRGVRARWRHGGGPFLRPGDVILPGEIYEAEVAGVPVDVADVAVYEAFAWEQPYRAWPAGPARVWGTHGLAEPPEDLRRAAVVLARYLARTSKVPERAASMSTESTLIVFSKPDAQKPTGLPEVDAVITRRRIEAHV